MTGIVFKIQRHSLHDGPGIRTLVFLKGCPLRCWWCFNPESQALKVEILHYGEKCLGCGACIKTCPVPNALSVVSGRAVHDSSQCSGCSACVQVCPASAFSETGKTMTPEEVVEVVLRDKVFYDKSGGGVTLSGGEVTQQADFAAEVLELCKDRGIHTAIETCGYCSWDVLSKVLSWTDLVFYDLKAVDSEKHRLFTGAGNERILENLRRLSESGKPFTVRMPIVPGCNDSLDDLEKAVGFLRGFERIPEVHLLPYELFGIPKYDRLGRFYKLGEVLPPSGERMTELRNLFLAAGIPAEIGG